MKVTKQTGQGWVVGVTVPNGVIRVRRNGKECWTGNSGRETGGYSHEGLPAKGGGEGGGSKRLGSLDVSALLGHNAVEVLRDSQIVRGTKNEEYWNALKLGHPIPEPGVPFIYEKFINLLRAGGANVTKKGDIQLLSTMTDADVDRMSSGEITNSFTVDGASLNPRAGGLFDEAVTGGTVGKRWGHIALAQPVPNPAMEEPIRRLLGLKRKQLIDILSGRAELDGMTGGEAIKKKLADVTRDMDAKLEQYRNEAMNFRGSKRDNAIKCLRYLLGAKKQGVAPTEWMLSKIPVIPPVFRPVSKLGDTLLVSDMNDLYRDLIELNNHLKEGSAELPDSELAPAKEQLYDAVTAVMGWGEPITEEGRAKRLKGAIRQIIGENPKTGLMQSKVLSKTVDLVARGVVTPDPELDMDTVGIPEDTAWQLFKPFVTRELIRRGFPPVKVKDMIEKREKEAKDVLDKVMTERPVLMTRAPSWHKFNIMAFRAIPVKGKIMRVSPLITSGFNMDFDGDQANFHVPVSEKAVEEAWKKMTPSRNLFQLTDLKSPAHAPGYEMLLGLYQMTKPSSKGRKPIVFRNEREAVEAYNNGLIGLNDSIEIKGVQQ